MKRTEVGALSCGNARRPHVDSKAENGAETRDRDGHGLQGSGEGWGAGAV